MEIVYNAVNTVADAGEQGRLESNDAVVENAGFQEMGIMAALARKRMGLQSEVSRRVNRITEIFGATRCTRKLMYYRTALLQTLNDMKKFCRDLTKSRKSKFKKIKSTFNFPLLHIHEVYNCFS